MASEHGKQTGALHIVQYLTKWKQPDSEIVQLIEYNKHFSWKFIYKMWWRNCSNK